MSDGDERGKVVPHPRLLEGLSRIVRLGVRRTTSFFTGGDVIFLLVLILMVFGLGWLGGATQGNPQYDHQALSVTMLWLMAMSLLILLGLFQGFAQFTLWANVASYATFAAVSVSFMCLLYLVAKKIGVFW